MATKARWSPAFAAFVLACLCVILLGCAPQTLGPDDAGREYTFSPFSTSTGTPAPTASATATRTPTPTSTPTPTGTPSPTDTPTPSSMTGSSMITVNTGEIIDIIQEFRVFINIGPYFIFFRDGGSKCAKTQPGPTLAFDIQTIEQMEVIDLYSCGWQPGETVQVTAQYPSGKTLASFKVQAGEEGSQNGSPGKISLAYQPHIDDPTGKYTFTLTSKSGAVATTVLVTRPGGARLYHLTDNPWKPEKGMRGKRNTLLLWGFAPGEKVRLIVYRYSDTFTLKRYYSLFGFEDYTIPENGRVQVNLNLDTVGDQQQLLVMASGSQSGSALLQDYKNPAGVVSYGSIIDLYCPGAMPFRIDSRQPYVRAAFVDGTNLRIREQPGFSSSVLKSVPEGTVLERVQGNQFRCVDNTFWMQVHLPDGTSDTGWVAETYNGKYVVETLPKP